MERLFLFKGERKKESGTCDSVLENSPGVAAGVVGIAMYLPFPLCQQSLGNGPCGEDAEEQCDIATGLTNRCVCGRQQKGGRYRHHESYGSDRDGSVDVFNGRFLLKNFCF